MGNLIDLTGQRFGRLTVIDRVGKNRHREAVWSCQCDCGNECLVGGYNLRSGHSTSCGCLSVDKARLMNKSHGKYGSRLYNIWRNMKARCYRVSSEDFVNYGTRGITMFGEWKDDFQAFYDWAVVNGYREDLTIDRIDVNGNYCPENCRWVTPKEQANNTRLNRRIEFKGETNTISEWADICGIKYHTLYARIVIKRWGLEEALTTPTSN